MFLGVVTEVQGEAGEAGEAEEERSSIVLIVSTTFFFPRFLNHLCRHTCDHQTSPTEVKDLDKIDKKIIDFKSIEKKDKKSREKNPGRMKKKINRMKNNVDKKHFKF